ncbi:MAG: hypothetical protein ISS23_00175 [Nanoarchaeota archaeon]|nr:hypothetical protein [Nanoarchaeota archaeon]
MIHYKEDTLLSSECKNIYSSLVKPEKDLVNKNFCLRIPTISLVEKDKIINLTKKKYGDFNKGFLFFIRQIKDYTGINYTSIYKTKYRYLQLFKKNQANIIFLRVISLCLAANEQKSIPLFESFIIKGGRIDIKGLKLKVSNFGKRTSYLLGVIAGDGHLDKKGKGLIVICDGQSDKRKLSYSKKYLEFINDLFTREFCLKGKLVKQKTWWFLYLNSKWLCRFFNHYFEIPFGKKSNIIKLAKILSGSNENYFWRGMMDTDGFVNEKRQYMNLKSNSRMLIYQFKDFCNKNNIQVYIKKEKGWILNIPSCSFLNYAKLIGFSHPRKKGLLIKHLKKSPRYKVFKKLNKKLPYKMSELFKYLRPYKKSVYIKLEDHHRKAKKEDADNLLNKIKTTFGVKIIEVKRKRPNNHFHICSKKFTKFVKIHATYDLPWQPLNDYEIKKLLKEWTL